MKSKLFNIAMPRKRQLLQIAGALAFLCAVVVNATAQQGKPNASAPNATAPNATAPTPSQPALSQPQPPPNAKENLGPAADTIHPYRPYNRDPFKKALKPKTPKDKAKREALQLGYPVIDQRRAEFRQRVNEARERGLAEPAAVIQYLVNELEVTGVFHDERGYGLFVKALPTGTMLFLRPGEHCYNGEVARIEGDDAGSGAARVMFREFYKIEQNGKSVTQERMVVKTPSK